jgi:phospholipase C
MRRFALFAAAIALVAVVAVTASSRSAHATAKASIPSFKHVVVVMFENHGYDQIIGNDAEAPTFNSLATTYALMTDYHGVAHPSLPNYLAITSGSTDGIRSDCTRCVVKVKNLADSLDAVHKSWKTYAEDLPKAGATGASYGGAHGYVKRHDPFMYYKDIVSSAKRRAHIVPFTKFSQDVSNSHLPAFSLVIPTLQDDMHDGSISEGDTWLQNNIVPMINSPALGSNGVVFIVFDESEGGDKTGGGGHIAVIAAGPGVTPASTFAATTNHYGLLRTIEDAWKLPRLAKSKTATPITGIWQG